MRNYLQFGLQAVVVVIALVVVLAVPTSAQQTRADITGRVTDEQGRLVPGATVTATNKGTGAVRTATTNESGEYTINQLPPGVYDVTVEAKDFKRSLAQDLELNVGSTTTQNFELKPGEVTATVQVTSEGNLIETTTSELAKNITPAEVQNLPLLNRTFANLSIIAPEARPVGTFDPTKTHVGTVSFSGGDGRQVDVNVDGGDNKDNVVGSMLQNFAYESIQEFQVLQHRWTAESGRSVGGVVNVISKSGSNQFHGSGFINFRNQSLRAKDFFEKQGTDDKPSYDREEFGGSIGGPIVHDKLFFFGAIERFRERQNLLVNPTLLPQIAAIPGVTASPTIPLPYNDTLLTVKVDHTISEKQSMFYRYAFQKNDSPNDQFDPTLPSDLEGGNTNTNKLMSFVINHTYTFNPRMLNQFSFQYQNFENNILGVTTDPNLVFPAVQSGANVNVPQQTKERKFQFRDDISLTKGNHGLKFGVNYIHTELNGFFFFGANGHQIIWFDDPLVIKNNTNGLYPAGFATQGAINEITFNTGSGDTSQPPFHQLAFYIQDDYKVTPRLTLNLGLRWDANIKLLVDQTTNRTMLLLGQLNNPRADAITGDPGLISKTTSGYNEFQPRLGFAWDVKGNGQMVVRGGYGIFYDQIFQNLTLFSKQQGNPTIYQTVLDCVNSSVGNGQLATFRYGVDPLPTTACPGFPATPVDNTVLQTGAVGRINDPTLQDPYVQKWSFGVEMQLGRNYVLSSDYVHTLGLHENRVQNINPRITACPPGSTVSATCPRGGSTRFFDAAFVAAGMVAGRLEQINMFTSTNRSRYDSWATTLRRRTRNLMGSVSYILSKSQGWGGQPTASYGGNGIAVTPEIQFSPGEFGPTRIDERHRIVASGLIDLPYGFQIAPIIQFATARPYSLNSGSDLDGDGRSTVDRVCQGFSAQTLLQGIVAGSVPAGATVRGCAQTAVNSQRTGFVVNGTTLEERSGRFFNIDTRVTKTFPIGEKVKVKAYINFFNLLNRENLSFGDRLGLSVLTAASAFAQPTSLYGPGFGPPVGLPFTVQIGGRVEF